MNIFVNGKELAIAEQSTVSDLLRQRNLDCTRVAVELNRNVLTCDAFAETPLTDGDSLEIVQFVGGG